jgi:hypothetical protein
MGLSPRKKTEAARLHALGAAAKSWGCVAVYLRRRLVTRWVDVEAASARLRRSPWRRPDTLRRESP